MHTIVSDDDVIFSAFGKNSLGEDRSRNQERGPPTVPPWAGPRASARRVIMSQAIRVPFINAVLYGEKETNNNSISYEVMY